MRFAHRKPSHGLIAVAAVTVVVFSAAVHAAPPPGSAGTAVSLSGRSTLKVAGLGQRPAVDGSVSAELVFAAGEWIATDGDGETYEGATTRGEKALFFHYDASSRESVARVVAAWAREMLLDRRGIDTEVVAEVHDVRVSGELRKGGRRFVASGEIPFTATAPALGESRSGMYRFKLAGATRSVIFEGIGPGGPLRTLEIVVEGEGQVSGPGHGIPGCEDVCRFQADDGAAIELEAEPAPGWTFRGWSGCDDAAGAACTLLLWGDRRITATFAPGSGLASVARITSLPRMGLQFQPFRMTFECVGPVCVSALGKLVFSVQWVAYVLDEVPPATVDWSAPSGTVSCISEYGCSTSASSGELVVPSPYAGRYCFRVKNGTPQGREPWSTERCIDVRSTGVLL